MKNTKPKIQRGIRKPRGYDPDDKEKNHFLARQDGIKGRPVSPAAMSFFDVCIAAKGDDEVANATDFELRLHSLTKEDRTHSEKFFESNIRWLGIKAMQAIEKRDSEFFNDIGRLCEYKDRIGKLSLRGWLLCVSGGGVYTAKELCGCAKALGYGEIEERRMHEICGRLGIKLRKIQGKRGSLRRISNS